MTSPSMRSLLPLWTLLWLSGCALLLCAPAHGQTEAPAPVAPSAAMPAVGSLAREAPRTAAPDASRHVWYGWQIILVDLTSVALVVKGLGSGSAPVAGLGGVALVLGGPIVHGVHGRPGAFAGSLGLRVGLPLLGAAIGAGRGGGCDACGYGPEGFVLGAAGAMLLDAVVLAHEEVPATPLSTLRVAPSLGRERKSLALAMNF
jgi:hypothetical protein